MAKRGGYPGMGGGMNMNNIMKQAQKMQKQMEEIDSSEALVVDTLPLKSPVN